jgi:hypothetical protein
MAKKNTISEIKGFGTSIKTKNQVKAKNQKTVAHNQQWEAWQFGLSEADNLENWRQVGEGTLDECFEEVGEQIACQLEEPIMEDGTFEKLVDKYDNGVTHEPELLLEVLGKLKAPGLAKLKAQCLENGECQGKGWAIAVAPSKFKQQFIQLIKDFPFAYSDAWEAGALSLGDGEDEEEDEEDQEVIEFREEEFDDGLGQEEDEDDEEGNWQYIAEGCPLEECLQSIMFFLTMEVDSEMDGQISDDIDMQKFFAAKAKLRSQKREVVKRTCLINGECEGDGWQIRSQRTREQCEWLAKNGQPSSF